MTSCCLRVDSNKRKLHQGNDVVHATKWSFCNRSLEIHHQTGRICPLARTQESCFSSRFWPQNVRFPMQCSEKSRVWPTACKAVPQELVVSLPRASNCLLWHNQSLRDMQNVRLKVLLQFVTSATKLPEHYGGKHIMQTLTTAVTCLLFPPLSRKKILIRTWKNCKFALQTLAWQFIYGTYPLQMHASHQTFQGMHEKIEFWVCRVDISNHGKKFDIEASRWTNCCVNDTLLQQVTPALSTERDVNSAHQHIDVVATPSYSKKFKSWQISAYDKSEQVSVCSFAELSIWCHSNICVSST